MKKLLIAAVSSMLIIVIIWIICSWYTGKKIETEFNTYIEYIDKILKNTTPEAGISIKIENYQRKIFTSNTDIVINIKKNDEEKNAIVRFATKIFHGPFPINKIAKFNLLPKAIFITIKLIKNETTEELFKYAQEQVFVTCNLDIDYNKNLNINLNLSPLNGSPCGKNIIFSGGTINYAGNSNLKDIKFSVVSDNFIISNKEKTKNILFNGLAIQSTFLPILFDFHSGKQILNIADIDFKNDNVKFSLKNSVINFYSMLKDSNINDKNFFSINDFIIKEQNFDSNNLMLLIERTNDKVFANFLNDYNNKIAYKLTNDTPVYSINAIFPQLLTDDLLNLLKNITGIIIKHFY